MPRSVIQNPLDKIIYLFVDLSIPILIKYNIHPNLITMLGFIPIVLIYNYILQKNRILTYLFAFINYTLDCLDGELARKSNKTSWLGGFLDSLHDFTSLFSILYIIFGYHAIYILAVFSWLIIYIFEFDPIKHTAKNNQNIFDFFHDNLNVFYFLTIEIIFRYL